MPSQYGSSLIESEPSSTWFSISPALYLQLMYSGYSMDQNYIPPMRMSQPASTGGTSAYTQTISSSPALYQSRTMPASSSSGRRHSELRNPNTSDPSYNQNYRRISNPYDSMSGADYSMAPSQTIPSISGLTQSPLPSPHMGATSGPGMMPQYNTSASRYVSNAEWNVMHADNMEIAQPVRFWHVFAILHNGIFSGICTKPKSQLSTSICR